jgi:hypothetical protein
MSRPAAIDIVRPRRTLRPGTRIEAVQVGKDRRLYRADPGVPPGTGGEVRYVDITGTTHVIWDDGKGGIVLPEEAIRIL